MGVLRVCLAVTTGLWRSRWSAYHRAAEEEARRSKSRKRWRIADSLTLIRVAAATKDTPNRLRL